MNLHENGSNNHSHSLPKLEIVAMMSVPPLKVTEPRRVCQVLAVDREDDDNNTTTKPITTRTIGGCYQIVMYYRQFNEEDNGWSLAGWIVESLAKALLDHPLLAGRLRRRDDMGLEIVSNDSGIRLLEARWPASLSRFLEVGYEEGSLEAELVFWKEIDEDCPDFSPLFYVQVTNFECGGYSIGISCSLLLAEALVVENFLKKWAEIHNNMLPKNGEIKKPTFYHPCLKNPEPLPSDVIGRTPRKNGVESMVFKITSKDLSFKKELWRELAMICVEEAEKEHNIQMGSDFPFLLKESKSIIKVEECSINNNGCNVQGLVLKNQIIRSTWDDFGLYEVAFYGGNKPLLVSCWIASVACGNVMAVPYQKGNVSAVVIVSPPR